MARILDFGVARARQFAGSARHRTGRGVVIGTPWTMSPEQARGALIDHRADVWALACCAYEAITATAVVDGDDPRAVLARVSALDLKPFREDRPWLSEPLQSVFDVAFAGPIDARYPDSTSFAQALAAAVVAPVSEVVSDVGDRSRRRRLQALGDHLPRVRDTGKVR